MQAFINADPEIEEELHRAYDNIHGMVTIRDYAIPWVTELKVAESSPARSMRPFSIKMS